MSLKEQSRKLKEEIYRLKMSTALPKQSVPHHRQLHDILFGKKASEPVTRLNLSCIDNTSDSDDILQTESSTTDETLQKELSRVIYRQNRNATKQEVKEIKEIENLPTGCTIKLRPRPRQEDHESLGQTLKKVNRAENDENDMLRRNMLSTAKVYRKDRLEASNKKALNISIKNNDFAETCSVIYSQKKSSSNDRLKNLIMQKRINKEV